MAVADLYQPLGLVWTCAVLGLLVGSFLNVVIARLPVMMERAWTEECADWMADVEAGGQLAGVAVAGTLAGSDPASNSAEHAAAVEQAATPQPPPVFNLLHPPSRCPGCTAPIRPWQNIPLVSWVLLRGRCAACKRPISARYPFVELLSAVLCGAVATRFGPGLQTAAGLLLVWGLLALAFIDLDTQYLPDQLTLPLLWAGLLVNSAHGFVPLADAVWGAAAGYLLLWSVYWVFRLITGKEGMGAGDFKLLAALGAWFGYQALPAMVLISSLIGAVVGIAAIAFAGRDRTLPIPFGPFLVLAGLAGLFLRTELLL